MSKTDRYSVLSAGYEKMDFQFTVAVRCGGRIDDAEGWHSYRAVQRLQGAGAG